MAAATAASPAPASRLPIVGVMGSGVDACDDLADPLGRWLEQAGVHLLNGGGGGVMAAVSRAFHAVTPRAGLVIGILPGEADEMRHLAKPGYPNAWIDVPIYTHLPLSGADGMDARSRNPINVLTSDVVVALPGGEGTRSEVHLAVRFGKPVIVWFGTHRVDWAPPDGARRAETLEDVQRFVRVCLGLGTTL